MKSHSTDILTRSGHYFDFTDLESNVIEIEDIAHGLSHVCRFAGQVPQFYCVAQHSVLVWWIVRDVLGVTDPTVWMQALLHDATEAYIGDMTSPLKRMMKEYQSLESRLDYLVLRRFGLSPLLDPWVRKADLMALAIEKRELWGNPDAWDVLEGVEEVDWRLEPIGSADAKEQFLLCYDYIRKQIELAQ